MTNNYYNYNELRKKATRKNATKQDRLNLLSWFDQYGQDYWNGEGYCIDGKKDLWIYPIYKEEEDGSIIVIDATFNYNEYFEKNL